jgi:hypothetical protein
VTVDTEAGSLVESVTVEEHYLRVEYVPARAPERSTERDESVAA